MKKLLLIILFVLCLCFSVFGQFNDTEKMFGQQLNLGHWSTDGLVFYFRGIEAGNAVDESFYQNHGTITGATWVGDGLSFDGDDVVGVGTAIGKPAQATIIVKVALNAWGNVGLVVESANNGASATLWGIIGRDAGDVLEYWVSTGAAFQQWAAGTWSATEFPQGQFNTIAFTHDGSTLCFYKNGIQQNTVAQTASNSGSPTGLRIGELGTLPAWFINGIISDTKIYNRALSASEILDLYINPDLPMQDEPIWLMRAVSGINIGAIMQELRGAKRGGKQAKSGGKQ